MPGFNSYLRDFPAPLPPYTADYAIRIPVLTPLIIGALELRAHLFHYTADSGYGAVQGIREVQLSVINGVGNIDALYRLIDNGINGTLYEETSPGIIEPLIPAFPPGDVLPYSILGMLSTLPPLYRLSDNFMQGTVYAGEFDDDRNPRQQLEDILAALEGDDPDFAAIIAQLELIVAALG